MKSDDNTQYVNINNIPKGFKALMLLLPLAGLILIPCKLDNDFYFLYPTGEYIVNNGFPTKDFLSMHSNMDIIVQQWLSDVIFYGVYKLFGLIGIMLTVYITYILFTFLMFKLCKLITNNFFISSCVTFVGSMVMSALFYRSRPQIFTYLIILTELYVLEKFVKDGKIKHLFVIPVLSLLLINMHSSMWAMFFVFMMPYFAAALPINLKKFKQVPCCSFVKLFVAAVVAFAAGFLNPYGTKAMAYILTSFGYDEINCYIGEMAAVSAGSAIGSLFLGILFTSVVIMLSKKGCYTTRFVLFYLGTLILALTTIKSIAYFIIAAFPAMAYYMKDFTFDLKITKESSSKTKLKRTVLIGVLIVLIACAFVSIYNSNTNGKDDEVAITSTRYSELNDIIDIIKKSDDDITLYCGFDNGPYLEYYGLHPYIDCRAELFLKDNNNEYDYMKEHVQLLGGEIYYKEVFDKYDFNYLIVSEQKELSLYNNMLHDDDYELVYDGENMNLFVKK